MVEWKCRPYALCKPWYYSASLRLITKHSMKPKHYRHDFLKVHFLSSNHIPSSHKVSQPKSITGSHKWESANPTPPAVRQRNPHPPNKTKRKEQSSSTCPTKSPTAYYANGTQAPSASPSHHSNGSSTLHPHHHHHSLLPHPHQPPLQSRPHPPQHPPSYQPTPPPPPTTQPHSYPSPAPNNPTCTANPSSSPTSPPAP